MAIHEIAEMLAGMPGFEGIPDDHLGFIAGCATNAGFEQDEYLFREGERADAFWVVRRGRVALEVHAPGRGQVLVETIGEGELVGWSWLFPPYRWHFDARASEPVRAIAFDGACLRGKCDEDSALGYELMQRFAAMMLDRLQATRLRLLDVYGQAPVG